MFETGSWTKNKEEEEDYTWLDQESSSVIYQNYCRITAHRTVATVVGAQSGQLQRKAEVVILHLSLVQRQEPFHRLFGSWLDPDAEGRPITEGLSKQTGQITDWSFPKTQ